MTFLTGITHDGADRFRPEVRSVDERVSLSAVVEAVADIMQAANRLGMVDRALAARIGSEIHLAVAEAFTAGRILSGAELVGQQAFRTILSQHLATTSSAFTDQEARRAMLEFMERHANVTGADFANFVAQFRRGGGYAEHISLASLRDGSGARFDSLSGASLEREMARLRHIALHEGLAWAADRPEILRMGEAAIRLFARTHFSRESYDRLRTAGFQSREIETLVRRAEESGQDANELARTTDDTIRILGGGDPHRSQELHDALTAFHDRPLDAGAWDRVDHLLQHFETAGTREQQEQAHKQHEAEERIKQAAAELAARAAQDAAERAAREARERAEAERTRQEAAERAAREREEREARERAAREAAERAARERAEAVTQTDVAGLDALLAGSTTTAPAPTYGPQRPPVVITQPIPSPTAPAPTGQQMATATQVTAPTLRG